MKLSHHQTAITKARQELTKGLSQEKQTVIANDIKKDWQAIGSATLALERCSSSNSKVPTGLRAITAFFALIARTAKANHQKTLAGRVTALRLAIIQAQAYQTGTELNSVEREPLITAINKAIGLPEEGKRGPTGKDTLTAGIQKEGFIALGASLGVITVSAAATIVCLQCFAGGHFMGLAASIAFVAVILTALICSSITHSRLESTRTLRDGTHPAITRAISALAKKQRLIENYSRSSLCTDDSNN